MNYYDEEIEIKSDEMDSLLEASPSTHSQPQTTDLQSSSSSTVMRNNKPSELKRKDSILTKQQQESFESDSEDLSKSDDNKESSERSITSGKWRNLSVPSDIKEIFQYILKYAPQNVDIEYRLQPFIPEFVPAVGDVDAFLKVSWPENLNPEKKDETSELIKKLGLVILDEPSGNQSEPSLLSMKLRSVMPNTGSDVAIKVPIVKTPKDIHKWITEIDQLHMSHNHKTTAELQPSVDIDTLMSEWPQSFEQALNKIGLPPPDMECSLEFYLKIIAPLFDINIKNDSQAQYIMAIHTLFNLFLAINNSFE